MQTADHLTGLTSASPTVNISKAGAAFGAAAGTVTELANGWYKIALTTADTGTAGDLAFHITAASGDPTDFIDQVTDPAVANLGINVVNWLGTVVATPATAGIPEVDVKNINNVSTASVTTVKAVQGLTTADTIATYTGNTPQTGDAYARLGAPAGASVSADIAEIEAETDGIAAIPTSNGTNQTGDSYALLTGVNTEVTSVPASTASLVSMIKWVYLLARNKITQTVTTQLVKANDGTTTVGTSTISDDGTTATRGNFS